MENGKEVGEEILIKFDHNTKKLGNYVLNLKIGV
jgi:hypothetical protein